MKSNNHLIGLSNNATHIKNKLIHEHDFIRARTKETDKFFLVNCITCGIYCCDLSARLCVKKHQYRGFANEKIQQH